MCNQDHNLFKLQPQTSFLPSLINKKIGIKARHDYYTKYDI